MVRVYWLIEPCQHNFGFEYCNEEWDCCTADCGVFYNKWTQNFHRTDCVHKVVIHYPGQCESEDD